MMCGIGWFRIVVAREMPPDCDLAEQVA